MKVTNAFNERRHKLLEEGSIEPKYFAICDYGVTGVAAIIGAPNDEAAEAFYDNVIGSTSPLCQKFGCTAMEVGRDNAVRAIGVGVKYYDINTFEKVAK